MDKAITTELASREKLMASLRNRNFQLAIFADLPEDRDLYCQRFNEDRLCVSFPPDHPLAQKKGITFDDLKDISVIAAGNAGYWIHVCEQNMPKRNLVVQDNVEALVELVESSSMPVFSSQHLVDQGECRAGACHGAHYGRGCPCRVLSGLPADGEAEVRLPLQCLKVPDDPDNVHNGPLSFEKRKKLIHAWQGRDL